MTGQPAAKTVISLPESHEDVRVQAQKLLKRARALGVYPTPIDKLVDVAGIRELEDVEEARRAFLASVPDTVKNTFLSAWRKLKGFADLRRGTTYAAIEGSELQSRWVRLHELGHQLLPWQKDNAAFADDTYSLSPACEERFEAEANDFAAQLLFQGDRFPAVATAAGDTMEQVFRLGDRYGASRHATARHFAGEAREPVLLLTYYESPYTVKHGLPELRLGRGHSASESFLTKHSELRVPRTLDVQHPWAAARTSLVVECGEAGLECGDGSSAKFQWEAWWNRYRLLVLVWRRQGVRLMRLK